MSKTRIYGVWSAMMRRCYNPNVKGFSDYGGRGIGVAERWRTFEPFFADMGIPDPGMTLERNDTNGDYSPENCIWATRKIQARNKRNNIVLTLDGRTMKLFEWAETLGIARSTLYQRYRSGAPVERILKEAIR